MAEQGESMAWDRLFHPRLGHSDKVCQLSWFERAVWQCYILTADDYGVMRFSAVVLQAADDKLDLEPREAVQGALQRVADVGLIGTFDHQGKRYCYQPDWQDFQKVRHPRQTIEPMPPAEVIAQCSPATQELFRKRTEPPQPIDCPADAGIPQHSRKVSETFPQRSGHISDLRARGYAGNANANANDLPDGQGEQFWERWRTLFAQTQHGARVPDLAPRMKDIEHIVALVDAYPDGDYLAKMAELYLRLDVADLRGKPRSVGMFRHWAPYCDGELRKNGVRPKGEAA